jgi:EAL domain-containing protein (putative c-di-GMP-specific phosphodiesterase class I)
MNASAVERLEMASELRRAIDGNEFELHYQPQVDREAKLLGFEALVRWRHRPRAWSRR